MDILPKVVLDLLDEYPDEMREVLDRLRREPELKEIRFTGHDGQPIIIRRVHPR